LKFVYTRQLQLVNRSEREGYKKRRSGMSQHRKSAKQRAEEASFFIFNDPLVRHAIVACVVAIVIVSEMSSMYHSSHSVRNIRNMAVENIDTMSIHLQTSPSKADRIMAEHVSEASHDAQIYVAGTRGRFTRLNATSTSQVHILEVTNASATPSPLEKHALFQRTDALTAGYTVPKLGDLPPQATANSDNNLSTISLSEFEPSPLWQSFRSALKNRGRGKEVGQKGFKQKGRQQNDTETLNLAQKAASIVDSRGKASMSGSRSRALDNRTKAANVKEAVQSEMRTESSITYHDERKKTTLLVEDERVESFSKHVGAVGGEQDEEKEEGKRSGAERFRKENEKGGIESKASKGDGVEGGKNVQGGNPSSKKVETGHKPFRGVIMPPETIPEDTKFDNITRLSYMMYRLIKTHQIKSMVDIPCINTLEWMPQLLRQLDFEVAGFQYYCVVANDEDKIRAQAKFGDVDSPEYIVVNEYWRTNLVTVDMAFLWNILGFMSPMQSWHLIKSVRRSQTKYILLPNYPELRHNSGAATHHGRVNIRRAPYRFCEALRVFNNISITPLITKQMLFYDAEHLRSDDLRR
jgi:hypothetical protein